MKRVLIVTYHFPPNAEVGSRRPLALANYLSEFGWEPTVLTVREPDQVTVDLRTLDELRPDVRVVRSFSLELPRLARKLKGGKSGGNAPGYNETSQKRQGGLLAWLNRFAYDWVYVPDKRIGWIPFGLTTALRLHGTRGFDAVLTTSPPHSVHLIGLAFNGFYPGVPWVADFRDLWTRNTTMARWDLPRRMTIEQKLERRVLLRAARLVTTSNVSRRNLAALVPGSAEKVVAIPNGYEPWLADAVQSLRPNGRFRLSITGRIYPGTVRPLLQGVDLALRLEPGMQKVLEVLLMGHPDDPEIRRLPRRLRPFVRIEPFRNKYEAARAQAESALLVCPVPQGPFADGWIPYRLVEYISRKRPVLLIGEDGEARDIVRRSGIGCVARPNDIEAVAESILAAFRRYQRGDVDLVPDPAMLKEWSVKNRVRQFARLLDEVAKG